MADLNARDTELILTQGVYAYVQDDTKGQISTYVGPIKQSMSPTDKPVTYNTETGRFRPCTQAEAVQTNIRVEKGSYVILSNPPQDGKQPQLGQATVMPTDKLRYGQIENQAGPLSFPLWPGQSAKVLKGHNLRSNEYLLIRVYDDDAARTNWDKSVVKTVPSTPAPEQYQEQSREPVDQIVSQTPRDTQTPSQQAAQAPQRKTLGVDKSELVTGQLIIVRGTVVSFYIPPTGVEVLPEENGSYVRAAVTLERLEYSILLDEDGNKEYRKGPDVVFPTPTQRFYTQGTDKRKFRAYELQPTTGIHVKVIADYTDQGGAEHKTGDELFITGAEQSIYFPCPEHAIISYGGNEKSFAVAIPAGEGRYVLDRKSGHIRLAEGPGMLLPNPINEVIVQRILTDKECDLYYPGNDEVKKVNRDLRATESAGSDGVIGTDTEMHLHGLSRTRSSTLGAAAAMTMSYESASLGNAVAAMASAATDKIKRSGTYTPPRTITLNTKFEGSVKIKVWSGYAIQVVNSQGARRLVMGPATVQLQYDEYLEPLALSKGKPKSSDNGVIPTAFLRYISNPVSDIITLKTKDLVNVEIQLRYLVRFDPVQKEKWFSVDNYVQYMADHMRSLIGNRVRNISVQEFNDAAADILRDTVLGRHTEDGGKGKRPLHHFEENGMTIYDLELIGIKILDTAVNNLLSESRQKSLTETVRLEQLRHEESITGAQEGLRREIALEQSRTQELADNLAAEKTQRALAGKRAELEGILSLDMQREQSRRDTAAIAGAVLSMQLETRKAADAQDQAVAAAEQVRQIELLVTEAQASETKARAVQPALVEALAALAQTGMLAALENIAPLSIVRGESLVGTIEQLFGGTPLESIVKNVGALSKVKQLGK